MPLRSHLALPSPLTLRNVPPKLCKGGKNAHVTGLLGGFAKIMQVKRLAQHLPYSECPAKGTSVLFRHG